MRTIKINKKLKKAIAKAVVRMSHPSHIEPTAYCNPEEQKVKWFEDREDVPVGYLHVYFFVQLGINDFSPEEVGEELATNYCIDCCHDTITLDDEGVPTRDWA
jgi:hypothetical protein